MTEIKMTEIKKETQTSKTPITARLKLFGIIVVTMTPFLYILGYYYTSGYLYTFGLNNEFFVREFDFYLIKGYESIYTMIGDYVVNLIENHRKMLFLILIIFVMILIVLLLVLFENKIKSSIDKSKKWVKRSKYIENISLSILLPLAGYLAIFLVPMLLLILLSIPYASYLQGNEIGLKELSDFKNCITSEMEINNNCIEIKRGTTMTKGMFIAKTKDSIALWTSEGLRVIENDMLIKVIQGEKKIN